MEKGKKKKSKKLMEEQGRDNGRGGKDKKD